MMASRSASLQSLLALLLLLVAQASSQTTADYSPILRPPPDEVIQAGSTYDIIWEVTKKYNGTSTIYLLGGQIVEDLSITGIVAKNVNELAGTHSWAVPTNLALPMYEFQIVNDADKTIYQYSNPFRVVKASTSTTSSSTSATAPPTTPPSDAGNPRPTATPPSQEQQTAAQLPPGAIAGIVIGAIAAISALIAGWFLCLRRRRSRHHESLPELESPTNQRDGGWLASDVKPQGLEGLHELNTSANVEAVELDAQRASFYGYSHHGQPQDDRFDGTLVSPETERSYPSRPMSTGSIAPTPQSVLPPYQFGPTEKPTERLADEK